MRIVRATVMQISLEFEFSDATQTRVLTSKIPNGCKPPVLS